MSPMQEFMLLHALSGRGDDTLFNQFVFRIDHALDPDVFQNAWDQVVATHPALRTAFIWKGVKEPQQVVRQKVSVTCDVIDLRGEEPGNQESRINSLLAEDRAAGFDFRRAPLMRFMLIRLDVNLWRMVWSSHHLILDRWCIDVLFAQFQRYYRALLNNDGMALVKGPSFRDYIGWIRQQDERSTRFYWTDYLKGFCAPTLTAGLFESDEFLKGERAAQATLSLDPQQTRAARARAASLKVTFSCLVQAALAVAINRISHNQDVVFGMTVSGRPAELPHVEDIVGSFINSIPVRARFARTTVLGEWLRALNSAQFASGGKDYMSPAQLRSCTSLPAEKPLFEILMVWLSQTSLEESERNSGEAVHLEAMSEQYATAFPLTLSMIETPDTLTLRADSAAGRPLPLEPLLAAIRDSLDALLAVSANDTLDCIAGAAFEGDSAAAQAGGSGVVMPVSADAEASSDNVRAGRESEPLEAMEELLISEWQRLLEVNDPIAAEQDFFELGGDSLKAASLHTRIESATRKSVPLLALFERSTLRGMARTLVNERWPLRAGIAVPLQVNGSRPAVFCVASPEVNTLGYAMLTRHLPANQNMVLLQAPPSSDELAQMHPDELSGYASRYVTALKSIQADGPYYLLSMCSGSHIAIEMIRQLERQGDVIRFAGVINTWSLYSISWKFYLNRLINVASYYRDRLAQVLTRRQAGQDRDIPMNGETGFVNEGDGEGDKPVVLQSDARLLPADAAVGLDNPWIRQVGFSHRMPAMQRVRATITVFRLASQPYWRVNDDALGWGRLAEEAVTVDIDGDDHDSILREPGVRHFAERFTLALANSSKDLSNEGNYELKPDLISD